MSRSLLLRSLVAAWSLAACSGGADATRDMTDATADAAAATADAPPPDDLLLPADDALPPPDDAAPLPDAAMVASDGAPPPFDAAAPHDGASPDAASPSHDAAPPPHDAASPVDAAAVCATPVETVIYDAAAWNVLADAIVADASPCADHFFSIPATADVDGNKTMPRAGEAAKMHARGPRFHALAEFHWGSWSKVTTMTWYQRGVAFRQRMAAAGYDVGAGDGWAVNELPSTIRTDATTRQNARDALRGLFTGPQGAPTSRGAVFIIGLGQGTINLAPYKANVESWLGDTPFWTDMAAHARFWAQEVYPDPAYTCVPNTTVATRSDHLNQFVEHVAALAAAGPKSIAVAHAYLDAAYVPLMNAAWRAPAYDTMITLDEMKHFVSGEVYAARAWASSHPYPGGRIGFAWTRAQGVSDADLAALAARLASSLHYAYDSGGGSAAHSCSPSGAYTFCQCSIAGAQFNDKWQTFDTY